MPQSFAQGVPIGLVVYIPVLTSILKFEIYIYGILVSCIHHKKQPTPLHWMEKKVWYCKKVGIP